MSAAPPAADGWRGACALCANSKQVRIVEVTPGQRIQACFDCRPFREAQPIKKFAVLYRAYAYLIEAPDAIEAAKLFADEAASVDDFSSQIQWNAQDSVEWRAAWRRAAVVTIRDRPLPAGLA